MALILSKHVICLSANYLGAIDYLLFSASKIRRSECSFPKPIRVIDTGGFPTRKRNGDARKHPRNGIYANMLT